MPCVVEAEERLARHVEEERKKREEEDRLEAERLAKEAKAAADAEREADRLRQLQKARADVEPDMKQDVEIPWSDEELRSVFTKFSSTDDKEVRADDLPALLRYLGARPQDEEVDALVKGQTQYACLDWAEFVEFIRRYREYDVHHLCEMFMAADSDSNGELDFTELHNLLTLSGYSPTIAASKEAMQSIDEDGSGAISFDEFEKLREHLRMTRGLMKAEAEELQALYTRAAGGPHKSLPSDNIHRISAYLGYPATKNTIRIILKNIDRDATNMVNFDELLSVIRALRDQESAQISLAFRLRGEPRGQSAFVKALQDIHVSKPDAPASVRSGSCSSLGSSSARASFSENTYVLGRDQLAVTLSELGYYATDELVNEILEKMKEQMSEEGYITEEEFINFLMEYRQVEGFTQAKISDLIEIFQREQQASAIGDADDSLDCLELSRVLRWVGISRTIQDVQRLIEEIDFDGSGQVEFNEFLKLMRELLWAESKERRKVFDRFDPAKSSTIGQGNTSLDGVREQPEGGASATEEKVEGPDLVPGQMPWFCLRKAIRLLTRVEPDTGMLSEALQVTKMAGALHFSVLDFERIFAAYREILMHTVRDNAGYLPDEVHRMERLFAKYAKQGAVHGPELRHFIAENIPEATRSVAAQQEVQRILRDVAPDTPGRLLFNQFLWFMRRTDDLRDERDILREGEVLKTLNFTSEEVEGYRQLFSGAADWAGDLDVQGLKSIFGRITDLSLSEGEELESMVKCLSKDRCAVRFPEFLQLMRMLVDGNKLGLSDAADRVLRRQQRSKAR